MLVWEMLITTDREQDLTNPTGYPAWFHGLIGRKPNNIRVEGGVAKADLPDEDNSPVLGLLPFEAAWSSPDDRLWNPAIRRMWEQGIGALRFAVGQLRKGKTRKPGIEAEIAMGTWAGYVGRLQIAVRFQSGKFTHYQTLATPGSSISSAVWSGLDERQRELATAIDTLFQKAFASLIDGVSADHFCEDCGRAMDATTPTGRASKASICPKCSRARWKENKGVEGVRAQWRKNKQEEREQNK